MSLSGCPSRPTRRVLPQPFGMVTQGGDRSFNDAAVANSLTVGSVLTVPSVRTSEVASQADLSLIACGNLIANGTNGNFAFENDVEIRAGNNVTLVANNFNIVGNFPMLNTCTVFCANGNMTVGSFANVVLETPSVVVQNDLTVAGALVVRDVVCTGNINVNTADMVIKNNLITDSITTNNDLIALGDATVDGTLEVCNVFCPGGNLTLGSATNTVAVNADLNVAGNASVVHNLAADNITTDNLVAVNLLVCNVSCASGNLDLNANNVNVPANLVVGGNLLVCNVESCLPNSNLNLLADNVVANGNLFVANTLTTQDLAVLGGAIDVCNLVCAGALVLDSPNVNLTGNMLVQGNAQVTGDANVGGTLFACNVVCAAGNLVLNGNGSVVVNGDLSVAGSADVANLQATSLTTCNVVCAGPVLQIDAANVVTNGNFATAGDLDVAGDASVGGILSVCEVDCPGGTLNLNAPTVSVQGDLNIVNLLTVQDLNVNNMLGVCNVVCTGQLNLNATSVAINNNLTVSNVLTAVSAFANNATVGNNLNVCNVVCGAGTLAITSPNVVANGNLVVTNLLTVNTLTVTSLLAQAPNLLLDYNVTSGVVGYLNDAVLPNSTAGVTKLMGWNSSTSTPAKIVNANLQVGDNNDALLGWDATTSTPSRFTLAVGVPQQLLTRNAATGAIVWSALADYATAGANANPIGLNATTGVLELKPYWNLLWTGRSSNQAVAAGTLTTVVFNITSSSTTNISYSTATGVATFLQLGCYLFSLNISMTGTLGPGGFISFRADGSPPAGAEFIRSANNLTNWSWSGPFPRGVGNTVYCTVISDAANTLRGGAGNLGLLCQLNISRIS